MSTTDSDPGAPPGTPGGSAASGSGRWKLPGQFSAKSKAKLKSLEERMNFIDPEIESVNTRVDVVEISASTNANRINQLQADLDELARSGFASRDQRDQGHGRGHGRGQGGGARARGADRWYTTETEEVTTTEMMTTRTTTEDTTTRTKEEYFSDSESLIRDSKGKGMIEWKEACLVRFFNGSGLTILA